MRHYYIRALALCAVLGVSGQAFALWHCWAHPEGDIHHMDNGYGASRGEAVSRALAKCNDRHPDGDCVLEDCHIEPN
jgi:hypothetical protein